MSWWQWVLTIGAGWAVACVLCAIAVVLLIRFEPRG
jgi:hypothetical protein